MRMSTIESNNRKYWTKMIDLSAKHRSIYPWELVKITSKQANNILIPFKNHPPFGYFDPVHYGIKFALCVVEGKPVFEGDILYNKFGEEYMPLGRCDNPNIIICSSITNPKFSIDVEYLSWNREANKLTNEEIDILLCHLSEGIHVPRYPLYVRENLIKKLKNSNVAL